VNPSATHDVLGIDPTDHDPTVVEFHLDDTRPDAALHRHHRSPACPTADLDEKQHALAFEMRDGASACGAPC
jgi:hypothetical protein